MTSTPEGNCCLKASSVGDIFWPIFLFATAAAGTDEEEEAPDAFPEAPPEEGPPVAAVDAESETVAGGGTYVCVLMWHVLTYTKT